MTVSKPLNSPPVANAGADTTIYLPDQGELQLDGSKSNDPDAGGRPMDYFWTKLSGPDVQYFSAHQAITTMIVLLPGTYEFELRVTDAEASVARDTVTITALWGVTCSPANTTANSSYQLEATLDESVPIDMSFARGGRKLVFAGGRTDQDDGWSGSDVYSPNVYVYDLVSKTTISTVLSQARGRIGIAVTNNEVFFSGGILLNNVTDVVDIFDLTARTMTSAKLSVARSTISSEVAGNKVFFAGGRNKFHESLDVVDIYDLNAKTWSVAKLSMARSGISIVSAGSKVYFAGGETNAGFVTGRLDIYDLNTGQWSAVDLSTPRTDISSSLVGNNVVFAGGHFPGPSRRVNQADFLNPSSLATHSECLIARISWDMTYGPNMISAVVKGRDLYYLGNYLITRYQSDVQKWSMSVIPPNMGLVGLASEGNSLYGIALDPDNTSNGYLGKIKIYSISL
jgi:Galactose oxidase, central domain/Kelch motif